MDAAPETLPASLSGGLRTWAALAAMIFAAPDFLLLDEPTNILDRKGTRGGGVEAHLVRAPILSDRPPVPAGGGQRKGVGDNIGRCGFGLGLGSGRRACRSRTGRRKQDHGRGGQGSYQGRTLNGSCQPFGEAENIS
jgi:hypothetical protein